MTYFLGLLLAGGGPKLCRSAFYPPQTSSINDTDWKVLVEPPNSSNLTGFAPLDYVSKDESLLPSFLLITYDYSANGSENGLFSMLQRVLKVLRQPDVLTFVPGHPSDRRDAGCAGRGCSSIQECTHFYTCFFDASQSVSNRDVESIAGDFQSCYDRGSGYGRHSTNFSDRSSQIRCLLNAQNATGNEIVSARLDVNNPQYLQDRWTHYGTDENLQTLLQGGVDTDNVFWPNFPSNQSNGFLQQIGASLLDDSNLQCSLKIPCPEFAYETVGSRHTIDLGLGGKVFNSVWGYLVLLALHNINIQLRDQWVHLDTPAAQTALVTFDIDVFYPKPSSYLSLPKAVGGLGTIFSAIAGFIPIFTPGLGVAGSIIPAIGSTIEGIIREMAASQPRIASKDFAAAVSGLYPKLVNAFEDLSESLFQGASIGSNGTSISTMLTGGHWIDPDTIFPISDTFTHLNTEILSRAVNALWKSAPRNKVWVLYVDLGDLPPSKERCIVDRTGPQASKYCADGGVYYLYNFIEDGDLSGHVDYPWGMPDNAKTISPDMDLTVSASFNHHFSVNRSTH